MSLETQITAVWERANHAGGALAEAIHITRDGADHAARGEALILLDEARRALNTATTLAEAQIAHLAKSLRVK
jgi:hypothetical protein